MGCFDKGMRGLFEKKILMAVVPTASIVKPSRSMRRQAELNSANPLKSRSLGEAFERAALAVEAFLCDSLDGFAQLGVVVEKLAEVAGMKGE